MCLPHDFLRSSLLDCCRSRIMHHDHNPDTQLFSLQGKQQCDDNFLLPCLTVRISDENLAVSARLLLSRALNSVFANNQWNKDRSWTLLLNLLALSHFIWRTGPCLLSQSSATFLRGIASAKWCIHIYMQISFKSGIKLTMIRICRITCSISWERERPLLLFRNYLHFQMALAQ